MKNNIKSTIAIIIILTVIMPFNVLSQGCLPNGITFTTQSQIDSFPINYPNCTEIEGSIIITGSNITNLSGLSSIQKIGGGLSIINTDSLINLIGLNLTDTIGSLYIKNNTSLQNFNGLESLNYTNGIYLESNDALINFEGLNSLKYDGYTFEVHSNNSLINFQGLDSLVYIEDIIMIYNNSSLINFSGIESLTSAKSLYIINNSSLINMTGLDGLAGDINTLQIEENSNLKSLNGLQSINTVNDLFHLSYNTKLVDIIALENITFNVGGSFGIQYNDSLSECAILSICNYIEIFNYGIYNNAPNCNSTAEVDSICNLTNIENFEPVQFVSVSPNPATNTLSINISNITLQTIAIYNLTGQLVLSVNIKSIENSYSIDISDLPVGSYFLRVVGKNNVWAEKFMVIK